MDKKKDIERFIRILRRQWEFIEIGGYTVVDAVADVLSDHYGHVVVADSSVCPPSIV